MNIAQIVKELQDLAGASESGVLTPVYMRVEKDVFFTPKFELDDTDSLETTVCIVPQPDPDEDSICEVCGAPCEDDSEWCVCDKCWERTKEIQDLREDIMRAIESKCKARLDTLFDRTLRADIMDAINSVTQEYIHRKRD